MKTGFKSEPKDTPTNHSQTKNADNVVKYAKQDS
jgi:hypothetical protein